MRVNAALASPSIFTTLRVDVARGRGLTPEDARPGAPPVALITHGFWLNGQVDAVAHVLALHRAGDRASFAQAATGLSVWGGAGSVADTECRANSPCPPEEAAADVPRFYRAMIALAEGLEREQLGTPRTRDVANALRGWLLRAV